MINVGKPLGESLQLSRKLVSVDLRRRNVALEPYEDFAVETTAIPLSAFLEPKNPRGAGPLRRPLAVMADAVRDVCARSLAHDTEMHLRKPPSSLAL